MTDKRIALVTGAGRGLGAGMARHLTSAGVAVLGTYHTSEVKDGDDLVFCHLDVTRLDTYPEFVATVRSTLKDRFGVQGFDYLVHNAGIGTYAPYAVTTPEQFDELIQVNLKAPFFLTQALLPLINEGGRVLHVTTALTRGVVPGMSAYAATKGAIEVLTRYQALELADRSIRVNRIDHRPVRRPEPLNGRGTDVGLRAVATSASVPTSRSVSYPAARGGAARDTVHGSRGGLMGATGSCTYDALSRRGIRSAAALVGAVLLLLTQAAPAQAGTLDEVAESEDAARLLLWDRHDPATDSTRLVVGRSDGSRARDLTSPAAGVKDTEPVRSPDGQSVIFNREAGDSVGIAVVAVTRPGSIRMIDTHCGEVPDCAVDINPRFARDGRHIVFTRVFAPFDPETGDAAEAPLYIADSDGSNARRLSDGHLPRGAEDTVPRYSPDGSFIVFVRDQRVDGALHFAIHRMNADGSRVRRLTPWSLDADRPAISPARPGPTAGLIAFETHGGFAPTQGDVVTIPADCPTVRACTAALRHVTRNAGTDKSSFAASWSPDGRRIAYADQTGDGPAVDVWTADWTGGHRHRVTDAADPEFSPAWSY